MTPLGKTIDTLIRDAQQLRRRLKRLPKPEARKLALKMLIGAGILTKRGRLKAHYRHGAVAEPLQRQ